MKKDMSFMRVDLDINQDQRSREMEICVNGQLICNVELELYHHKKTLDVVILDNDGEVCLHRELPLKQLEAKEYKLIRCQDITGKIVYKMITADQGRLLYLIFTDNTYIRIEGENQDQYPAIRNEVRDCDQSEIEKGLKG